MKKLLLFSVSIIFILVQITCNSETKNVQQLNDTVIPNAAVIDTIVENRLHNIVWSIPEVKMKTQELRKINPDISLITTIQAYPDSEGPFYLVEFAESLETHKANIYYFLIKEKTYEVYYQNPVSGESLPLEEYRKKFKDLNAH